MMRLVMCILFLSLSLSFLRADDGKRMRYLDEFNPYYPSSTFPKLTTPQWVGEQGVEAVVILAIDDMRGPERWETYLRPILNRLKGIDGRAPVSIMTCEVDPRHPHLQTWLQEGVSLECHTIDHPCPLLRDGDLAKAKSTYDRCVDLMASIPNNRPVAFRVPCCDSLNTPSPRFWAEIFNKTTPQGNFLSIDSSVFNVFTSNDLDLPRELVIDADGQDKFRKYLPRDRTFVNTIENYPYPYVIGRLCWEFPCVTPSDWAAQHFHKPNNPVTVRDWAAALDATVLKQGVFCLVFHPHGWIKNEQIVELIDYAVAKHGKKVKFLNFREALERLNKNLLQGQSLRHARTGQDAGFVLVDRNQDGRLEVEKAAPAQNVSAAPSLPDGIQQFTADGKDNGVRFVDLDEDGFDDLIFANEAFYGIYLYSPREQGWTRKVSAGKQGEPGAIPPIARNGTNNGFWVHSRHLWWQNEHTNLLRDHVDRRSFNDLLKDLEPSPKSPAASLRSLQLRPGFVAELVAAEPLVQDPIAFAWGPDGKLWVVEMGDYPLGIDGKGQHGGRIKFLEDRDRDGQYDHATVFLDQLGYPTGVLPWRKGVLVTCAPDIFYAEDTNSDGKADVRKVLFTGFGEGNQQHRVNSLVWGLDNWIYCANGDSGGWVSTPQAATPRLNLAGRDFRIRPDEGKIEPQTGQTQYGRSRDDWGNHFGGNNSEPIWHFVFDDRYLRRNPHAVYPDTRALVPMVPGVAPVYPTSRTLPRFNDYHTANRFTSACSPIVYRDELFGPHFINNTFVSEPVHNLVHREVMVPDGVTFKSRRALDEQQSEFLASTDNWFRPTMLQTGPDGALWIADMYRHVIEHPQWIPLEWQKKLDLRAGHDKGRIYRVYPVGVRPRAIPRLDQLSVAELVAALDSPNGWQRDTAQMLLLWRCQDLPAEQARAVINQLEQLASVSKRPLARLHALCTLDGLEALRPQVVKQALADEHPGVRRHAVRLSEQFFESNPELGEAVAAMIGDPDAQVSLQLACSLGSWKVQQAGTALGKLACSHKSDRYLLAAIASSLHQDNLEAVTNAILDMEQTPPLQLLENLFRTAQGLHQQRPVALLLRAAGTPRNGRHENWQFAAVAAWLDTTDPQEDFLKRAQGDEELRSVLQGLGDIFTAARRVVHEPANSETRQAALRLLGRGPDQRAEDIRLLAGLLTPQVDAEIQSAAVAQLGRLSGANVPLALLQNWSGIGPTLRAQVLEVLSRREEWLPSLLNALEHRQIKPSEIGAFYRQRLLEHRSTDVQQRARALFTDSTNSDRQKVIDSFSVVSGLKGDPVKGRTNFVKHCAACHRLGDLGNAVGPDLGSLNDKSDAALLVAVLDPNRAVEDRYVTYVAATKNGLLLTGVLTAEAGGSITLTGADGKPQVLSRNDLESLTSTGRSPMPEGLEKDLTPQDLADLIAFIRAASPAPQRKYFPGNQPEVVRLRPDGFLLLSSAECEIYGSTLVLEHKYGNLGCWSSPDDHAVWTVEIPRAGRYLVSIDYACDPAVAGNTFVLHAGEATLTGRVENTGSWDIYRTTRVGEMSLPAGIIRVTMRAAGPIRGALIDLRSLRLVPKRR